MNTTDPARCEDFDSGAMGDPDRRCHRRGAGPTLRDCDWNVARADLLDVAIAGKQTAVYPLDTPGGWHLLGRTTLALFDPARNPAALLQPGDTVRFEPLA